MIMSLLTSLVLLVTLTLVDSTWMSSLAILGAKPDLGLLTVIWLSYRRGPLVGTSASFVSGLVDDALSSAPLGFGAFIKTLVAWLSSFLHGSLQLDHVFMPLLLGAGMTLVKALATIFLALLFGGQVASYDLLSRVLWVEVAYTALLAPLFFSLLDGLSALIQRLGGRLG